MKFCNFKRFLCVLFLIFICFFIGKIFLNALFPITYREIILTESDSNALDPYLIFALVKTESNFSSDAISDKNAIGLMQITEPTAKWVAGKIPINDFEVQMLRNPAINIRMGTWYFAHLLSVYNDEELALCAYNAGSGNVNNWLDNPAYSNDGQSLITIPFVETANYIKKVRRYKQIYMWLYPEI